MLAIKYMFSGFDFASRNKREMSVARDVGFDVLICDYGPAAGSMVIDGFPVERRSRVLSSNLLLRRVQILVDLLVVQPLKLRSKGADVISGHDLLGLGVAWLSMWFLPAAQRPKLVYDAHEFTVGQQRGWKRSVVAFCERFLLQRSAFAIVVNDDIADRVQKVHGLKNRPVVVRSTPSSWEVDEERRSLRRAAFCHALGMPDDSTLLMYHGGVIPHRGIEMAIQVLVERPKVALIVLGNGVPQYVAELRERAAILDVAGRVLFLPAVPMEHLAEYVGAVDAGMVTVPAVTESYYLMLPNKFFENVQALTPVIASNFPAIASLVRNYGIGLLVDPEDLQQVGEAVDQVRSDKVLYRRMKQNLLVAKADLCWEREKEGLVTAYSGLLP